LITRRLNVSRYAGDPPVADGSPDRIIRGGPLYEEKEVLSLAAAGQLLLWSSGAIRDAQKWSFELDDLCRLVSLAVQRGRYLRSEWCEQRPNGPWAACDAYRVTRFEWNEAAHKDFELAYYMKFAISKTGQMLLSASNHPEGA